MTSKSEYAAGADIINSVENAAKSISFTDVTSGASFTVSSDTTTGTLTLESGTTKIENVIAGTSDTTAEGISYLFTDVTGNGLTTDDTLAITLPGTGASDELAYKGVVSVDGVNYYVGVSGTETGQTATVYSDDTYKTESSSSIEFTFIDTDTVVNNGTEYFSYKTGGEEEKGTAISSTATGTVNSLNITQLWNGTTVRNVLMGVE